ncbi:MAG: hypothetical protein AB1938_30455 [Myxococcota bacterium]
MFPLLLAMLAQTPVDLPATPAPLSGSMPGVALSGQQYVITWVDDVFDGLWSRPLVLRDRRDLWMTRVESDGVVASPTRVCPASPAERPAVVVHPPSGVVFAFWHERDNTGAWGLFRAAIGPNGDIDCLPVLSPSSPQKTQLRAVWTGTHFLLAWTEGLTGQLSGVWLDGTAAPQSGFISFGGPTTPIKSLSLGAKTGSVWLSFVDGLGNAQHANLAANATALPVTAILSTGFETAMDPLGGFTVVTGMSSQVVHLTDQMSSFALGMAPGRQPQVATALQHPRSVAAVEGALSTEIQVFQRDGGFPPQMFSDLREPVLAAENSGAVLVATDRSTALRATKIDLGPGTTGTIFAPRVLLASTAPQRRPSVVWAGDRFLISYEERLGVAYQTRITAIHPDNTLDPAITATALNDVALVSRPDGRLLVRHDVGTDTVSSDLTVDLAAGQVGLSPPVLTSALASAGAATNSRVLHWTRNTLYVQDNATRSFGTTTPFRSGAATSQELFLPVVANGGKLMTLFLTDADLAGAVGNLPMPQVQHTSSFDPRVTPAIAAIDTMSGRRAFIAWADASQPRVHFELFDEQGNVFQQDTIDGQGALRGLAVAASPHGWVLAFTDSSGLHLSGFDTEGVLAVTYLAGKTGDLAGEPVLAASPTGPVAAVWPVFSSPQSTLGLKALVVDPFLTSLDGGTYADAGVSDAGVSDAGATDGGGGGENVPTPGVEPILFETSCGCTAGGAAGWLLAALVVGARWARRRRA